MITNEAYFSPAKFIKQFHYEFGSNFLYSQSG